MTRSDAPAAVTEEEIPQANQASGVPPTDLLNTVVSKTWLQQASLGDFTGLVPFALITPPPDPEPTAATESGMQWLARALHLAAARRRLPNTDCPLIVERSAVWLRLSESTSRIRLAPATDAWVTLVRTGRPVCLAVGLDVMPASSFPAVCEDHLLSAGTADRLFVGLARIRTQHGSRSCPPPLPHIGQKGRA